MMPKVISPLSDAAKVAAFLEREEMLIEQSRHLDVASYRRRSEIEEELAEITRLLEAFGLKKLTPG